MVSTDCGSVRLFVVEGRHPVVYGAVRGCRCSPTKKSLATDVNLGVMGAPRFTRDSTDRNRTSPVAFTGNKVRLACTLFVPTRRAEVLPTSIVPLEP